MSEIIPLQHFGAIAITVLLAGLIFVPIKWPLGRHATFSQHVAVHKNAIIFYNILFTVALPLLLIFFIGWFVPVHHLSSLFIISVTIASVLQYAVTVIPETGGWKTNAHRLMAGWSAIFLLPPLIILLLSSPSNLAIQLITATALGVMACIITVITINKARHAQLLLLQASYFAAFFIAIMAATYL